MTRKQLLAIAGIGLAVAVLAVLAIRTDAAARFPLPSGNDPGARMAYAAQWLLLPALTLLAGIAGTGIWRFFSPEGFDGTPVPETTAAEILLRYNRNTLEQVVLAAVAWAGLALALPHERLNLIPVLAIVFVAGRACFWIGYQIAPWARAFGFTLTALPTVLALLWLAWGLLGQFSPP